MTTTLDTALADDAAALSPHERHLVVAIETAEFWIETSPDPAIRQAFRLALHELRALIPVVTS